MEAQTDESFSRSLATAIVAQRIQKEMTQEQVARAIDVPLSVYRSWERQRATPRGSAFYRLCVLFDWPHVLRSDLTTSEQNGCLAQLASDLGLSPVTPLEEPAGSLVGVG